MKSNLYQDCWPPSTSDGPILDIEPSIPLTNEEKISIIIEEVTEFRKTTFEKIDLPVRPRPIVQARQEIMKFVDEFTNLTLKETGSVFKQEFDHSTVIHAKDTIADLCFSDKKFKMQHELIRSKILSRI